MSGFLDKACVWLATGLGIGLVSPAPGTVGGLWGLPLAWAVALLPTVEARLIVILLMGLVSVAICSRAVRALGGGKDPQVIVLDEIAALPVVFLGVEASGWTWLVGWGLFRVFDILKPPPVRQFERLPGALGIVADDFVAAGFGCLVLWGLGS